MYKTVLYMKLAGMSSNQGEGWGTILCDASKVRAIYISLC